MNSIILPDKDKWLYRLFAAVLLLPMVNYYIAAIFWAFGASNPFAEILFAITYLCGFLSYIVRQNSSKLLIIFLLLILLLISFALTSGVLSEITGPVLIQSQLVTFLLMYFPLFLFAYDRSFNFRTALNYIYNPCKIIAVLCVVAYYCQVFLSGMGLQEYMTFAYTGLPAITIVTYFAWRRRERIAQIISILTWMTVLFGGCRGALFTLALFLVLFLLYNIKSSKARIWVLVLSIIVVGFSDQVLSSVGSIMEAAGYESRIFKLIEAGEAIESEGRNVVFEKAISLIGFYGNGLFSDRVLLQHVDDAIYCHNWVLEILVDFGYILGVPILIWISHLIFSALKKSISLKDEYFVFCLIFCLTFLCGKYMLSNSYLHSSEIPIILGWLISSSRNEKSNFQLTNYES